MILRRALRALAVVFAGGLVAACSSHPHPHPVGPPEPKGSATPVEIEPDAGVPTSIDAPSLPDVNASR